MGGYVSRHVKKDERYSISPAVKPSSNKVPHTQVPIPPYFWGEAKDTTLIQPILRGYEEGRDLIGQGTLDDLDALVDEALQYLERVYSDLQKPESATDNHVVTLHLSDEILRWKKEQHEAGRILPSKGRGLKRTSPEVIRLLGAEKWPEPLLTNNALFGSGWANLLIGAYDAPTLYSNYCLDMSFYYEHGYAKVFPQFESVVNEASHDERALQTTAGTERRKATDMGLKYIRGKVDLEVQYLAVLSGRSARMDRRTAQIICFAESSLTAMAAEVIVRGFDPAGVMADLVFSNPGTDVLDIGSDLGNSEVMNSFLNTADFSATGVVTEVALRQVYDAYSYTCARMLTERWYEPTSRMAAQLYIWHMKNDRHMFLRRAVLGYSKARKTPPDQREADFDEVFDQYFHTTGFSRPLECACNGLETCDMVQQLVESSKASDRLKKLWYSLTVGPLEYVSNGIVDGDREDELGDILVKQMAHAYALGLIEEMTWLICHASHHAWQVNFLMEAAMFGSFLDDGALTGKLDRAD